MARIHDYPGAELTVRFDPSRCIHAAECVRGLPKVFRPKERPWVSTDAAGAEEVAQVVHRCPTGALSFEWADAERQKAEKDRAPELPRARLEANGPVFIEGKVTLKDSSGETTVEETRIALCRCGASENKPFCDGSHAKVEFEAEATIAQHKLGELEEEEVLALEGVVAANGPVVLKGPMEILEGDGTVAFRGQRCALCRCGASQNKPFCDGSHVAAGFEAP